MTDAAKTDTLSRLARHACVSVLAMVAGLIPLAAPAQSAASVEALQSPAWLVRGGRPTPLAPGASVAAGDVVRTGAGGRVRLRLAEGSHVKLGENAGFRVARFQRPADERRSAFHGFLDVLRGAFRFTTTALSRARRRELDIRISGITAGIRGTDLWGKAAPDRDIVCLIEGRISVARGGATPFVMDEPLSFYIAPKDGPAEPVAPVDPDQLARWAAETEPAEGAGTLAPGGAWRVHLMSHRRRDYAEAALARLREAGFPVRLTEAEVGGEAWLRLTVEGFASGAEARGFAGRMRGRFGIRDAWAAGG